MAVAVYAKNHRRVDVSQNAIDVISPGLATVLIRRERSP
jgi:hypothetical protein